MSLLDDSTPTFKLNDLPSIYLDDIAQKKRYEAVIEAFRAQYGKSPDFLARSPGRVNLIGEHIDYSGYSVLPMAIEKDAVMAVAVEDSDEPAVELANMNPKFPYRKFLHSPKGHVEIDSTVHEWSNYFKCGYKGVLENIDAKARSMKVMMDGTVPTGGGLSSSSAFVCCAALATLTAHKETMTKGKLTETAIQSEQYAGVAIGGMDQSISVMAPKGSALLIDFYPKLDASSIALPTKSPEPVFVIANTMVTSDKHVTAPRNYNLRVVETRFAAAILNQKLGLNLNAHKLTLKKVHEAYVGLDGDAVSKLDQMLLQVEKFLKKTKYSIDDISKELELDVQSATSTYIGSIVIEADGFHLYNRAKHVFSEAQLVYRFRDVCTQPEPQLKELGDLMNASHKSCSELFDCSCAELDELTSLARKEGAVGSRLTGAGWGGCTVSLVPKDKLESFMIAIREKYYLKRNLRDKSEIDNYLFATQPSVGAFIMEL